MTGWRIGYAAGPAPIIEAMTNYQSHSTSNPNAAAQYAAIAALAGDQAPMRAMVAAFDQRRVALVNALNGIDGLSCAMPHGAFYVMLNIQGALGRRCKGRLLRGSLDFAEALLEDERVAVVPGVAFAAEGYARLSYASALDRLLEGARRLDRFMQSLD
jgi:aspartate aminotransferase